MTETRRHVPDGFQGFTPLIPFDHIAAGVSGGSDSIALMVSLSDFARATGKKLTILTVDHGLRAESGTEAAMVARLAAARGLQHRVLRWSGAKPVAGLANAARGARYDLMASECAANGIGALALGHTLDDQVETVLMRLRRTRAESRGLSGMAATTVFQSEPDRSVLLVRPLLALRRVALKAQLRAEGLCWVDDPTNDNPAYERVQVRRALQSAPRLFDDLAAYAALAGRYRRVLSQAAANFLRAYCRVNAFDLWTIDHAALLRVPEPVAILALQVVLSVAGGRDYLPPVEDVRSVLESAKPRTLARVQIRTEQQARREGLRTLILLRREVRDLPTMARIEKDAMLWDRRFWIVPRKGSETEPETGPEFCAGYHIPAGRQIVLPSGLTCHGERLSEAERRRFATIPFQISKVRALGTFPEFSLVRACGALDRFCPDFDLPIRKALTTLFTVIEQNKFTEDF